MKRLAIITTHPIQYYAPLFQLLTERKKIAVKVFYTWGEQAKAKVFDPGFGKTIEWDIPLLHGYDYEFVHNVSAHPDSKHFKGIINPGLIADIKKFGADAILVIGWAFHSHLKAMRYFKGKIPVMFRGDSTLLDEPKGFTLKKTIRSLFLRWVYSHIDYAIYVGANNKKYYEAFGVTGSRLLYAPHAIDNERFSDNAAAYEQKAFEWRASLGIPAEKSVVLFAGKLEAKKNPAFLIEAAKRLPGMHFIIIGNGPLEKEIKDKSVASDITLIPFQNQSVMPVAYRLCDIFVLPSHGPEETWGLSVNEAMACGRIVIATNKCGGAIDLIENGVNGYVINPNIESFIAALQKLGTDKNNYTTLKENSLHRIRNFSFQKIAETIEGCMLNKH